MSNITQSTTYSTIQAAIDDADDGDELVLLENINEPGTVIVDKKIILNGDGHSITFTSGSGKRGIQLQQNKAGGSVFKNLHFKKNAGAIQYIYITNGNHGVTIDNVYFEGYYSDTNQEESWGINQLVSNDLVITNSTFDGLRKPGYINGPSTGGQMTNNTFKLIGAGWTINANAEYDISNNTWEQHADSYDITFNSEKSSDNYYTCPVMDYIRANNSLSPILRNLLLPDGCPDPLEMGTLVVQNQTCNDLGQIEVNWLGGLGDYTVEWTGGGSEIVTASPYTISNLNAGSYTITVTDQFGAVVTGTSTVADDSADPVYTATANGKTLSGGEEIKVCEGDNIELSISGTSTDTYVLKQGTATIFSGFVDGSSITLAADSDLAGNYTLTVTSGTCEVITSYTLVVNPKPSFTATANGKTLSDGDEITVCEGDDIDLALTGNDSGTFVLKLGSTTMLSGSGNATYSLPAETGLSGTYTLTVSNGGCEVTTSYTLNVNPQPEFTVTANGIEVVDGLITVCEGEELKVALTGTAGDKYVLTQGSTQLLDGDVNDDYSFIATSSFAGDYTLTVTSGDCEVTTNYTLVVNPLPDFSLSVNGDDLADGGSLTVCEGEEITLTLTGYSSDTYVLEHEGSTVGAGNVNDAPFSFNASLSDAGSYTLTVTNGDCEVSTTYTLNVNSAPNFTSFVNGVEYNGNDPLVFCDGEDVELEITGDSADEYVLYFENPIGSHNWVENPGSSGNVNGGIFTLPISSISARDYLFVVTSPEGCESSMIFTVEVNEQPTYTATANGNTLSDGDEITVCEGDDIDLELTGNASDTFVLKLGSTTMLSGSVNATYSLPAEVGLSGTYTLTVSNGGCEVTTSYTLIVNPAPVITASPASQIVELGNATTEVTFDSDIAGTVFNWTNDNPSIGLAASGSGNSLPSFVPTTTGTATITVTPTANGCTGTPVSFTIEVVEAGVPDLTTSITVDPSNIIDFATMSVRVVVEEIAGAATDVSKPIYVTITGSANLSNMVFDNGQTTIGGLAVQNSDWDYLGQYGTDYVFEYTGNGGLLSANGDTSFGFTVTYSAGASSGQDSIGSIIFTGSGGEVNNDNNRASVLITFSNN